MTLLTGMRDGPGCRLLTVSNRGPFEYQRDAEGNVVAVPGQGGLATALRVAANLQPTTWLSSPLSEIDRKIAEKASDAPKIDSASHFVATDPEAYELFYGRFSNEVLWFLQHSLPWPEEVDAERRTDSWERGYEAINRSFADAVIDEWDSGEYRAVMFHDYHFYVAPGYVRAARPDVYLQHFVHVPWPGPQEWARLEPDILRAILEGLLGNDSLVLQTPDDTRSFLLTAQAFLPQVQVDIERGEIQSADGHQTRVWTDGISVDPEELEEEAASPEFSRYRWLLRASPGHKTIVRVDRLDLTKNVVKGFEAYQLLLEGHPELRGRVEFVALLVPSKTDIAVYGRYQDEAHELAEAINRRFGTLRWKPIHLIFEHNRTQALAAMSLYDVLLVNPVADGMNLVAKEGPMLNTHDGVLVLSRRAGAYAELSTGAIGVDPEDVAGTAEALHQALILSQPERRERAARMRAVIRAHDLRNWFAALLDDIDDHAPLVKAPAA